MLMTLLACLRRDPDPIADEEPVRSAPG
jgi:hypothetical protein